MSEQFTAYSCVLQENNLAIQIFILNVSYFLATTYLQYKGTMPKLQSYSFAILTSDACYNIHTKSRIINILFYSMLQQNLAAAAAALPRQLQ